MQIITNENNLAIFVKYVSQLTDEGVLIDGAISPQYNTSNCTEIDAVQPPVPVEFAYQWNGSEWIVYNQNIIDEYLEAEKIAINKMQKEKRQEAYPKDSDPIFFEYQRGTKTEQEWLDAVNDIKTRYPYE